MENDRTDCVLRVQIVKRVSDPQNEHWPPIREHYHQVLTNWCWVSLAISFSFYDKRYLTRNRFHATERKKLR